MAHDLTGTGQPLHTGPPHQRSPDEALANMFRAHLFTWSRAILLPGINAIAWDLCTAFPTVHYEHRPGQRRIVAYGPWEDVDGV